LRKKERRVGFSAEGVVYGNHFLLDWERNTEDSRTFARRAPERCLEVRLPGKARKTRNAGKAEKGHGK